MFRRLMPTVAALLWLVGPFVSAASAGTQAYDLGRGSEIDYFVEHPMHHVKGVTHALEGRVSIARDHLVTPLTLKLPLLSFNSGNGNRDNNAAFILDITHHPLATLEVQSFSETSRTKQDGAWHLVGTAKGRLSMHGITHTVEVPLEAIVSAAGLTVDGTFHVSLTSYDIERPSLLFTPINDDVKIAVHAIAAPVGP